MQRCGVLRRVITGLLIASSALGCTSSSSPDDTLSATDTEQRADRVETGTDDESTDLASTGERVSEDDPAERTSEPTDGLDDPGTLDEIHTALVALAEATGLPGFAVSVVDSSGLLGHRSWGVADLATGTPIAADTIFHIGSTHKAMNALLVATVVEDHGLSWDTPVAELLPDPLLDQVEVDPAISLRHLTTMSGGIDPEFEDVLDAESDEPMIEIFSGLASQELLVTPGTDFAYSNVSASAAGYVAVSIAGDAERFSDGDPLAAYRDLFTTRVLQPLAMDDTSLTWGEAHETGRYATGYFGVADELAAARPDTADDDLLAPSGSVRSTVGDVATFLQMMLRGGKMADGSRIVSETGFDALLAPEIDAYAMGWDVLVDDGDVRWYRHEGAYEGFVSVMVMSPDHDIGLVLLTNAEQPGEPLITQAPELLARVVGATLDG